jgi:solute carrier family 35 protein F1/2
VVAQVMVLSYCALRTRYTPRHYSGVGLCMLGLAVLVLIDVYGDDDKGGSTTTGDLFALSATFFYAFSNVR